MGVGRVSGRTILVFLILALLTGAVGGSVGGVLVRLTSEEESPAATGAGAVEERRVVVNEESAVTEVVRKAEPAMVTVISEAYPQRDSSGRLTTETAVGSGVIVDERGFVITNEHVVRDAVTLRVILYNGEEKSASLVGDDRPFSDLAVLRIQPGDLTAVPLGDSDALVLGQRVIAIGNTLSEFRNTVTLGVVSGLHRRWSRDGVMMEDLVQTDAAINHGNSGGALLNTQGELVGLNTTVVRTTETGETVEGVAFALSSNSIAPIARSIIEQGRFPRSFLGIAHTEVNPLVAQINGLPVSYGAYVTEVTPDSPAAEAGIQQGDIIVRMGDIALGEDMPFINALGRLQPNQKTEIVVNRGGREIALEVTLALR
jgi:S1-C subfamily serine protease